jgi:5'(3')-deoxyribonucleotidase
MRIAVDMDGTIADFTSAFRNKIRELYGLECDDGYIDAKSVYESLTADQRKKYKTHYEIYGDLCSPGFFSDLEPLHGAVEAVQELYDEEHEIYFLTKVLNWDRSAPEKALWLQHYFPGEKPKIIMVNNTKAKHLVNVDVIVDDDKRVLCGDTMAMKICIAQPWNKEFRESGTHDGMIVAQDMVEAKDIIINSLAPSYDEWGRLWCER